jgi:pyrroloquinoline quinone biosynthesis protein B
MDGRATGLTALVLGAAAGGGFPQWNCGCRLCRLARAGDPRARPATQASVAITGNGADWIEVGASPDLRQQIMQTPQLWPREGVRDSPLAAVVLLGGDVDALAGLLALRERQAFTVFAPQPMLDLLEENRIFDVLDRSAVRREPLVPGEPARCPGGVTLTLLPMPGKVPLYMETQGADAPEPGPTYAALLQANGRSVIVAPACAEITEAVRRQLRQADLVFFDGTLFTDDEMIKSGTGQKTGQRMGHLPIDGADGSLAALAGLGKRRIYVHINNTNPILIDGSPQRALVEAAGWEVAVDGLEIAL